MVENNDEFGFEEIKSTILDYFLMFREVKWAVATTIGVSIVIILITIGLFNLFLEMALATSDKKAPAAIMLGIVTLFTLGLWLPFSNGRLFLKILAKGRKQQKEFLVIQSYLIRRSYLMNFELVEPEIVIAEGNPRLEKVMNHLSYVFPELDRINKKRIKKKQSVEKYAKKFKRKLHFLRKYDLAIKSSTGWFIIQFFEDTLTFDDIEKITKKFSLEKKIGTEIQRVIVIGEKFDSSFDKENIAQRMESLKRKIHVDIISEDKFGYSTIWID